MRNKGQFVSAASRFTARAALRSAAGELGWVEQHQFPELFAAAAKMQPGEIAGPVELADGSFSLIYLEERRSARKRGFDEIKNGLLEKLWIQSLDSAYDAWIHEQKKKAGVVLYPDVLQKTINQDYYVKLKEWREKLKEGAG